MLLAGPGSPRRVVCQRSNRNGENRDDRQHGISRTDVTARLAHVGEDCAGAVHVVPPDRVDNTFGATTEADRQRLLEWLTRADIA